MDQGYSLDESIQYAIADFGNPKMVGKELKKTMVGGNMMKKLASGLFGICFFVLGALCVLKFIDLLTIYPDGGGIGVYFYGLEINDKVPEKDIMNYAIGFLGIGFLSLIVCGFLFKTGFTKKNKNISS